jgi:hypothetical protein
MSVDYKDWRIAYAIQAKADLRAREFLAQSDLPECQQLHFLQMACEKICKAHLCGTGTNPEHLQKSHAYISGALPVIARTQFAANGKNNPSDKSWVIGAVRVLAQKIEDLAPAVHHQGTVPANCEYPWLDANGKVIVPVQHKFGINLLKDKAGRTLLSILHKAADDLARG